MSPSKIRVVTAEDLYSFELPSHVRISPSGEAVVFSVQRVDPKTQEKYINLWLAPVDGGEPCRFTYGDQCDTSPEWSPDGKQIAFLSNRRDLEKPAQIYLIPSGGGEARPLTEILGEIESFHWAPDSCRLVCRVRKTDAEVLEREKDEQKKKLGQVARHYDRVFFKLDGEGYLPKERWHIWTVEVDTGKARQLTDSPVYDEQDVTWSPDGKHLAFLSNRSENPDFDLFHIDLYILPAAGGELREVKTPPGEKGLPSFSPDGQWIAYFASETNRETYKNMGLWIVPVDGSAEPRNLTEIYDLHSTAWTINDMGQPETMPPTWSNDGESIYFQAIQHGSTLLYKISIKGGSLETVIGSGGVVADFTFDRSQTRLAYLYGTMKDPGQVRVCDVPTGVVKELTGFNRDMLDHIDLGQVEEVWIPGPAGNQIQGWILKPPGFDPNKQYPSILEIHGGPQTQYGNYFMHEFYYLAANGYVVYFCNPRGGRGYGEEHTKAIYSDWGGADYDDLMAWTDFIASKPYIDKQRMGVTGGSYGGYMTVWIIGHTQRFRAAVAQRCVSNFVSMWGSSDFNWQFQQELNDKPPFEDLQKFWDHSPIKYIGNAKTPTLVIHSENDLRCPIEQGEQVFVALKRLGVDSEMVRFPNEFHGLSRTGRTDRRIVRLNHILRWFDKYLK